MTPTQHMTAPDLAAQDEAFERGRLVVRDWTGPLGAPLPPPLLKVTVPEHIPLIDWRAAGVATRDVIGAILIGLIAAAFFAFAVAYKCADVLATLIWKGLQRAWAALKRAPDACDCLGQILETAARKGCAWLLGRVRTGLSWVARQAGAVRQRAARARRKRLVRARRTCRDLFDPERLTETARLRIAAAAWDAQQERFERSTEITLTLAGAGLWAATIATSRVWS